MPNKKIKFGLICLLYFLPLQLQVGSSAWAQAVKVVMLENPDLGNGETRLRFPVVLDNGKGFKIKCQSQNDEEGVVRGLGFLALPTVLADPLSEEIVNARLEEQPLLCPYSSASYKIKAYRFDPGTGEQFYLQFPTGLSERGYGENLYIAGCSQLLQGLKVDPAAAIRADPTPFFQDRIFKIDCLNGTPVEARTETFGQWCLKKNSTVEQVKTVNALLAFTPYGTSALGDEVKCRNSEAFLANLSTINLSGQQITDLAPVGSLKQITQLILNNNAIADLAPLVELKKLILLNLAQNKIMNVSVLAGMNLLTDLNLEGNKVSDLRSLSALANLKKLNLGSNGLTNGSLGALAFITSLKELSLASNSITDPLALVDLAALERLDLSFNRIKSFEVIKRFRGAVQIIWRGNPIGFKGAGLLWGEELDGQFSFEQAKVKCGNSGGRLPTVEEFKALRVEMGYASPAGYNAKFFEGINFSARWLWSATPNQGEASEAWNFYGSSGEIFSADVDFKNSVRCIIVH